MIPVANLMMPPAGIIDLMRQINQQAGTTIVQVTHGTEIAALSDAVIAFWDGQVVAH